jgi:hypothetical protein
MAKRDEKYLEYASLIVNQISEMFGEDCENYIDEEELKDGKNLTDFFHALANAAPTLIYCHLTHNDINTLEFNHIANKLCFQYSTK